MLIFNFCSIFLWSLTYRVHKVITILQGHHVPYDYLLLCCGQQFEIAIPSGADISTLVTTAEVQSHRDPVFKGPLPDNVFTINAEQDAHEIMQWIENTFVDGEGWWYFLILGEPIFSEIISMYSIMNPVHVVT